MQESAYKYIVELSDGNNTFTHEAWGKTQEQAVNTVLGRFNGGDQFNVYVTKVHKEVQNEV